MFACIDKKDFAGARKYLADNVVFEFAHYTFKGAAQMIKNIGGFDVQFAEYHHGIEQVWQGEGVVMFGGHLRFVLKDGSSHSTPFWNIFTMAADNPQQVVKGSALFRYGYSAAELLAKRDRAKKAYTPSSGQRRDHER